MADRTVKGDKQLPALKALNSFSPRLFFFIIPVKKERFTDPFFRLLDSLNKSAKVP
jgi:hypothetical protein